MAKLADHSRIWFRTPDIETERQFVDEYILDAVERMDAAEDCEKFIFIRAGHAPSLDCGAVVVDIYGDPDAVIERETQRWNSLVDDGPLREWEHEEIDLPNLLADEFGEQGVVLHEELRDLASRMAPLVLDDFQSPPAVVDAFPEEDGSPVGWYRLLHFLCNHQGYDIDVEREAYLKNLETSIDTKAQIDGVDAAQATVDEYVEQLEQVRDDVEQYRDEQ